MAQRIGMGNGIWEYILMFSNTYDGTSNSQIFYSFDLQVGRELVSAHSKIQFVLMDNSKLESLFLCI